MSRGYEGIVTPEKLSEWEAVVRDVRAHLIGDADATQSVAADLRILLPRAKGVSGRSGLMGLDLHLAARQVAKQLMSAAAHQTHSAAAWTRADMIIKGLQSPASGGKSFDFTS